MCLCGMRCGRCPAAKRGSGIVSARPIPFCVGRCRRYLSGAQVSGETARRPQLRQCGALSGRCGAALVDAAGNARQLDDLQAFIDKVSQDKSLRVTGVTITGYASPDGPYAPNERLGAQTRDRFPELRRFPLPPFGQLSGHRIGRSRRVAGGGSGPWRLRRYPPSRRCCKS